MLNCINFNPNRLLHIVVLALLLTCCATAQMNDYSSTYFDAWSDPFYVYGYGSTIGEVQSHMYAVDVQIRSPSGILTTVTGYFTGSGTVGNSASLGVIEEGDYLVSTTHRGFCNQAYEEFSIAYWSQTQRPPPCGVTTATCADGNSVTPEAYMKSRTCDRSDNCCNVNGVPIVGWCRRETCTKCTQQNEAMPSQCRQSEQVCFTAPSFVCPPFDCQGRPYPPPKP
jgi:hypothetical protein